MRHRWAKVCKPLRRALPDSAGGAGAALDDDDRSADGETLRVDADLGIGVFENIIFGQGTTCDPAMAYDYKSLFFD